MGVIVDAPVQVARGAKTTTEWRHDCHIDCVVLKACVSCSGIARLGEISVDNKVEVFACSSSAANCKLGGAALTATYFSKVENAVTIAVCNENKFINISGNEHLQVTYTAVGISTRTIKHSMGKSISNGA